MEDINQLRNVIEQLEAEVFCLKSVIGNLPGSVYWKDKSGVYLGMNNYSLRKMASVELEHGGPDSIAGNTDYDFFPEEAARRYREHDIEVMANKEELSVEEPITLPSGKTIVQLSTKRPLYDERGEVSGVIGNTVDITHLKEIESELRRAKEEAEQASLVKMEFMRNMEHDIRTPFSGVWGMANYLYDIEEDEEKKEYLNDITQCAKELLDYCNSILDFSKIESGTLSVTDKKFKLEQLASSVAKIELPAAKHKKLTLEMNYDADIPAVVVGNAHRVHRILINLVSNAIKFTKAGSVSLSVSVVKKDKQEAILRFIVKDTGIGIPSDKQEYIFEKFSRLSLSNRGLYKGVGLGLKVVKQFMHDIGGEIDLISEEGVGTQFICTIPFKLPLTEDLSDNLEYRDD